MWPLKFDFPLLKNGKKQNSVMNSVMNQQIECDYNKVLTPQFTQYQSYSLYRDIDLTYLTK